MQLLDIRRDEWTKVIITWTMNVLLAVGYAIGWSAVHSMLVKRMGVEYLPYTYIGISLLGVFGSSVYLTFADAVRRDRLLIIFSAATGIVLVAARLLVSARPDGEQGLSVSLVLFFVAVFFAQGVGNSTLGTQVWTIINDIFRPSQGRRLYPIIGTAGTIGGIAGGASIHFLAGTLGTANLVLIWAASAFCLIPLALWLRRGHGGELQGRAAGRKSAPATGRIREGWGFVRSSPMAMTLCIVAVMFWVIGSIADFQYTRIMNATFPTEAKLAGYYGIYGMVINTSGLVVQMFLSGYLIRRAGVGRGLCALPATVLAGFSLVATWFVFWPGLLLRYSWDMVGMTLQGNSYQLALNAIPSALRARVRGFIDGVVNPLGGVLGGILILVLHHLFDARDGSGWSDPVTLAGVILALLWLIVVLRSRRHYIGLVAENLRSTDRRTAMDAIDCLEEPGSPAALRLLRETLQDSDPGKRTAAVRVLASLAGERSLPDMIAAVRDPDARVRIEAIKGLAVSGKSAFEDARRVVENVLAKDPVVAVRAEALRCLFAWHADEPDRGFAGHWLGHPDPALRMRTVEAVGRIDWDLRPLLLPRLEDESGEVRAAAVTALWKYEELRPSLERVLSAVLAESTTPSHAAALAACHRTGTCIDPDAPKRLTASDDPVVRVLAGAAVLRFCNGPDAHRDALNAIFLTMADEAHAGRLRAEVLPLVPHLGEAASDAILLAAARLPASEKSRVAGVLHEWRAALESQLENSP